MQTAENLKKRIQTAEDLQSVVKTMKALAAVSIRQYERAVESLAEYNRTVEMGLQVVLHGIPDVAPERKEGGDRTGAVIFGSDQGMCGQLNDQIVAHALAELGRLGGAAEKPRILAVGLRAAGRLEDAGQPLEETRSVPGSISGITPLVQELVMAVERWRSEAAVERVVLFYSEHFGGSSYRPSTVVLLPIDRAWLERIRSRRWPTKILPAFTMERPILLSRLIRQYFFVSLYRACAESLASENASRLASMQGAEKNIAERLGELNKQFHQQRQMSITEELLDIVAGFEALRG
jgi:F-type H+-transporting ATPase subunit gamma